MSNKLRLYLKRFVYIGIIIILGFFLIILLLTPLRNWGARRYLERGDKYLNDLKYLEAQIEYQKASILTPLDVKVSGKIKLTIDAETDISKLKSYFEAQSVTAMLNDFRAVDEIDADAEALTKLALSFIVRNEPQMAVVAATKATKVLPQYRDGWLYLAISHDKAARTGELSQKSIDWLINQRDKAYNQAVALDPAYFATWPK